MSFDSFPVRCIDPSCAKFGIRETVQGRRELLNHIQIKSTNRLRDILKYYNLNFDFNRISRWTLINIVADYSYDNIANQLIANRSGGL